MFEFSPEQLYDQLYRKTESWLHRHGIDYPWSSYNWSKTNFSTEKLPDSYAVWVSEVMLQQTRVETVRPYYLAWMQRWPKLVDLAQADEAQVLKHWEGLGYYNRALNMLRCARYCCNTLKTENLPASYTELLALPGIGPYIAAAVASISHNEAKLALDTNIKRIFSRIYQQQPGSEAEKCWQKQHELALSFCRWRGLANISLIQLGQQRCKSRAPECSRCPLERLCPASSTNLANWAEFPARKKRQCHKWQSRRLLLETAEPCYLLLRGRSGHLCHLWRWPEQNQLSALPNWYLLKLEQPEYLGRFVHAYLQNRETIEVYGLRLEKTAQKQQILNILNKKNGEAWEWRWAGLRELELLTLAGPYRKFLENFWGNS